MGWEAGAYSLLWIDDTSGARGWAHSSEGLVGRDVGAYSLCVNDTSSKQWRAGDAAGEY